MTNRQIECLFLILLYAVPTLFNLVISIYEEWENLHTIKDFLLPLKRGDNWLIWFPFVNLFYFGGYILGGIWWLIESFLNIKIKK